RAGIRLERDDEAARRSPTGDLQRVDPDVRTDVETVLARTHPRPEIRRQVGLVIRLQKPAEAWIEPERQAVDIGGHTPAAADRVQQMTVDRAEMAPKGRLAGAEARRERGHDAVKATEAAAEPLLRHCLPARARTSARH